MKKEKYITKKNNRKGEYYEIQVPTLEYNSKGRCIMALATAKTLKNAIIKRNDLQNEVNKGTYKKSFDSKMPFSAFLKEWYRNFKRPTLSANTASVQDIYMEKYIIPYWGYIKLNKVTSSQLQIYFDKLLSNGRIHPKVDTINKSITVSNLSKETVKKIRSLILNSLKYAEEENLISNNPAKRTTLPRETRTPVSKSEIFSNEDSKNFLDSIKDHIIYYPLFTLLFESGLRRSEVLGIKWSNVDLKDKNITIESSLVRDAQNNLIQKDNLKNRSSFRNIYISDKMINLLKDLKQYQEENDPRFNKSKNVFRNPNKIYTHPSSLYSFFKRNLKKLHLPENLKIHSIRHTVATRLIESNVPLTDIQLLCGWTTPKVLLDTYVHANNKNQKNIVESLSKLI